MNIRLLRRLAMLAAATTLLAQATACLHIPREVRTELEPGDNQTNNFIPNTSSLESTIDEDDESR